MMEWEQERYDLKRKLDAELFTRRHLEEEVENLQKELTDSKMQSETLMKKLKYSSDTLESRELEWKSEIEHLQTTLDAERKDHACEIQQLKSEIARLSDEKVTDKAAATSEVKTLKEVNEKLALNVQILETKLEKLIQENAELQKVTEEVLSEKSNLEEVLASKREVLAQCEEQNLALQEELALLKCENDSLKAFPNSVKGNSVFAECDDNRKALKRNLDELAEKYKDLKKQFKSKASEILRLKGEKSTLMKTIKELSSEQYSIDTPLMESHKARIKDLEYQVQQLKILQDTTNKRSVTDPNNKALDSLFDYHRKEIESLNEKLEKQSEALFLKSELLHTARRDLQILTAKYAYEQSERIRLQGENNLKLLENGKNSEDEDI